MGEFKAGQKLFVFGKAGVMVAQLEARAYTWKPCPEGGEELAVFVKSEAAHTGKFPWLSLSGAGAVSIFDICDALSTGFTIYKQSSTAGPSLPVRAPSTPLSSAWACALPPMPYS